MLTVKIFLILFSLQFNMDLNSNLSGAWISKQDNITTIYIFSDGYFTATKYTPTKFLETWGGPYITRDKHIEIVEEFNTTKMKTEKISFKFKVDKNELKIKHTGQEFTRIDNGIAPLAGVWKITKRKQGDQLLQIHQTGTRKTLKILSATRFQWFAIDPATNAFSGTGGGTYIFKDGKYIENIDFFSRDSSRVGASLSFDDHLEKGEWHHTGLSSKGDKIYEVWSRVK